MIFQWQRPLPPVRTTVVLDCCTQPPITGSGVGDSSLLKIKLKRFSDPVLPTYNTAPRNPAYDIYAMSVDRPFFQHMLDGMSETSWHGFVPAVIDSGHWQICRLRRETSDSVRRRVAGVIPAAVIRLS